MGMCASGDIGIEANGNARPDSQGARDLIDTPDLSARFSVDGVNAKTNGQLELRPRLPDPGEHDVIWPKAGSAGDLDLSSGIGVDSTAKIPDQPRDSDGGVGLERVMNPMGVVTEPSVKLRVSVPNDPRAVHIDWRAFLLCDRRDRHAVTDGTRWGGDGVGHASGTGGGRSHVPVDGTLHNTANLVS